MNDPETLAKAHWGYVSSILRTHGESEEVIEKCGHHYITAFVHGWKHAKEDDEYLRANIERRIYEAMAK